ncbi:hypothetical protein IMG5_153220 [Ichthyophthirius multifiliis]|uniref:Cyclic nucleotide-binding domain-containing protein n=1 Tax=Ichthyophthirius multifiliis TaxID=5932 RepID=G0QYY0_ICHMU|nr:hypothetical protein IMG5_153220 [Ichthyophthirius multifiliis]EGR29551.1 hypothetical protein IMG5_153220 [Ichthyophthirius multifiliis]|eukprot:XP_004030787.1 hypothetical protein IMG5_153220 [Ichthyophthirius multifiliis]
MPKIINDEKLQMQNKNKTTTSQKGLQDSQQNIRNMEENEEKQSQNKKVAILNKIKLNNTNFHIKKFIQLIRNQTSLRKIEQLSKQDFYHLNDLVDYNSKQLQQFTNKLSFNSFKNLLVQQIYFLENKIPVFSPTDPIVITWDIFYCFLTTLFLYLYSLFQFFCDQNDTFEVFVSYYPFILSIFFIELLFTFNKAYFYKDQIVKSRKKIAQKQLESYFLFDILSIFIILLEILNFKNAQRFLLIQFLLNTLVFLRIIGVFKKYYKITQIITLSDTQSYLLKLFNLIFMIFFVAHSVSIGWYLLGKSQKDNNFEIYWMKKVNILDLNWTQKYIFSLYWSLTTMTTIGYGDITPTNSYEIIFTVISMILMSCFFAYSINNIGMILQQIEKNSQELIQDTLIIQRYLDRKKINKQLKTRITNYLTYLNDEKRNRNKEEEEKVFQKLSNKLRKQITVEINKNILKKHLIFSYNFSEKTLKQLLFLMEEVLISPNEIIFNEEDINDQSIYFIENGTVEIFNPGIHNMKKNSVLKQLKQNQFFGEFSFFSGLARTASARSVNLSTLYRIKREDFLNVVQGNKQDFERFKMLEELLRFQNQRNFLNQSCYSCAENTHFLKNCPKTHLNIDSQFITLRYTYSRFQDRNDQFIRKSKKKIYKSLFFIKKNREIIRKLKKYISGVFEVFKVFFESSDSEIESELIISEENSQLNSCSEQESEFKKNKYNIRINRENQIENKSQYQNEFQNGINKEKEIMLILQKFNEVKIQNNNEDFYFQQQFEKGKIFTKFFPHNNFDKVLNQVKKNKIQLRYNRNKRTNFYLCQQINNDLEIINIFGNLNNQQTQIIMPQQASYGVYLKKKQKNPIFKK